MTIAIIGAGLTGLTAAYTLAKRGHSVTVFEKEKTLGGLAGGFKRPNWQWSLEFFYHHFFTDDDVLVNLAKELGIENEMIIKRPITATLVQNIQKNSENSEYSENQRVRGSEFQTIRKLRFSGILNFRPSDILSFLSFPKNMYQLDSPLHLLTFPFLSPLDKLRTAALLAFCKINPFWRPLEKITAERFFKTIGGSRAWNMLWQPLMEGKFGEYADKVPASWLWARFHKRTMKLGYFRGGFQTFIDTLADAIKKQGGIIYTNTQVQSIAPVIPEARRAIRDPSMQPIRFRIKSGMTNKHDVNFKFDKVLITTPSSVAAKILFSLQQQNSYIRTNSLPALPSGRFVDKRRLTSYMEQLQSTNHLYAQTLILETKEPILEKTYWLNIMDRSFPFIAVVAHTNMVDKKYYGGNHITYVGNYLPDGHPFLHMRKEQLLQKFLPYLQKINQQCNNVTIEQSYLFTSPSAQPVHTLNYSTIAPQLQTPIPGVYVANLDSIFPWDRGTNYAVDLGQKAAKVSLHGLKPVASLVCPRRNPVPSRRNVGAGTGVIHGIISRSSYE